MSHRERTWVMVLAGGAADPAESQNGYANHPTDTNLEHCSNEGRC
jgi:hypothetical protein